jgi:excisionase family DNA binding protein
MDGTKSLVGFLRYTEAATLLGISESGLRRKVMLREVPYYKPFGGKRGRVLFDPVELAAFVRASRVEVKHE